MSGEDCDDVPERWSSVFGCDDEFGEGNCCIAEDDEAIILVTPNVIEEPTRSRPCIQVAGN